MNIEWVPEMGFLAALLVIGPVLAHDHYSGYKTPRGSSCCNDRDCHPAEMRVGEDGQIELYYADAWRVPPLGKINEKPSPDGRWHVCWGGPLSGPPWVFCVIAPIEA